MNILKKSSLAALTFALGAMSPSFAQAECGDVTIAEMTWASTQAAARVDQFILKHGYGCNAETVPGDTVPTATSMSERARPDIAPELWLNNVKEPIERAVAEGRLVIAGDVLEDPAKNAGEGLWIPRYMLDTTPELATIEGIKRTLSCLKIQRTPLKVESSAAHQAGPVKSSSTICSKPLA